LVGIIKEFDQDKKEFDASIGPFLEDVEIDKEDQKDILDDLWKQLGFSQLTSVVSLSFLSSFSFGSIG
jgi:hypothetical protein